jgi:ATP-binding cassette subfamily B protein
MAMGLFVVCIQIALLFGALHYWQLGQLTIGDFVLIQAYLLTTIQQLFGINRNLRRFYESYADANEMVTILNTPHDVQDILEAPILKVTEGVIDFNDVDFYFHKERPILEKFNLKIKDNEKIALVGPSGAGKSTIIKLLLRFYDVKEGAILIDGQDIDKVTQDSLRDAIAFVPQEPILFHRSLMENIRYGRRDATDEEVLEAARKAHCHEFISGFPEQYETFVGERGVKLSGGERQRVAIARALLKNAPILVLDEATSSLDSESESLIQNALDVLMEGKTVITIAHRLSTIMKMDRIVVIDGGKVVAEGTHAELLEDENGLYHKLWSIQAGGFIDGGEDDEDEEAIESEVE